MFEKIIYINLSHRRDKNEFMTKQLRHYDWQWNGKCRIERFEAIYGNDSTKYPSLRDIVRKHQNIPADDFIKFSQETVVDNPRYRAKVSCWMSHFSIFERFVLCKSTDWIIVLEDDVLIQYGLHELRDHMIKTLERSTNHVDIIVLGDRIGICGSRAELQRHLYTYPMKNGHFGCESYAIRISSIPTFLSRLVLTKHRNGFPDIKHCSIDNMFSDLRQEGVLGIVPLDYKPYTFCIDPRSKNSDIEL